MARHTRQGRLLDEKMQAKGKGIFNQPAEPDRRRGRVILADDAATLSCCTAVLRVFDPGIGGYAKPGPTRWPTSTLMARP
jgi:hypothetical protein